MGAGLLAGTSGCSWAAKTIAGFQPAHGRADMVRRPALDVELHLEKLMPVGMLGERHAALVADPEIPVRSTLNRRISLDRSHFGRKSGMSSEPDYADPADCTNH